MRTLPSFEKIAGHDVTVWRDHTKDVDGFEHQFNTIFDQILAYERGKPINVANAEVSKVAR